MTLACFLLVLLLPSPKYVYSAPNKNKIKVDELPQTTNINEQNKKIHLELDSEVNNDKKVSPGQRQKRWFNYNGYGFPPINPIIYPSTGSSTFAAEQYPYLQIFQRINDFTNSLRQPSLPVSHFPVSFFPVIFIPQVGCRCNSPPAQNSNNATPMVDTRFPVLEDGRQNWGFVVNNDIDRPSVNNDNYDEIYSRPISFGSGRPNRPSDQPLPPVEQDSSQGGTTTSFESDSLSENRPISLDPVRPNRPLNRPAPPVEHGTVQAGGTLSPPLGPSSESQPIPPTTIRPELAPSPPRAPIRPGVIRSTTTTVAPALTPSICDAAILSCCHQPQITFDCFVSQGCSDPASYGAPCDVNVIFSVIEKFQKYYGQRT